MSVFVLLHPPIIVGNSVSGQRDPCSEPAHVLKKVHLLLFFGRAIKRCSALLRRLKEISTSPTQEKRNRGRVRFGQSRVNQQKQSRNHG